MTVRYGDDKCILTVVARLRRIGVLAGLWIDRNRAIHRLRSDGISQRITIRISANNTTAHWIILRDGVRVIRRFWRPIAVLVIVAIVDCCIDSTCTNKRQCGDRPSRQACCGRDKPSGSEVFLDFGKVEVRPRTGVLPPPMHAFHIFQNQVTTVTFIVLNEEAANGQRAAIREDNQEVTTDLLETLNRLRTDLDLDDAGLGERQIPRINNGNFAGRLGDDFRIHAFPRYKTSENFFTDSNHYPVHQTAKAGHRRRDHLSAHCHHHRRRSVAQVKNHRLAATLALNSKRTTSAYSALYTPQSLTPANKGSAEVALSGAFHGDTRRSVIPAPFQNQGGAPYAKRHNVVHRSTVLCQDVQ